MSICEIETFSTIEASPGVHYLGIRTHERCLTSCDKDPVCWPVFNSDKAGIITTIQTRPVREAGEFPPDRLTVASGPARAPNNKQDIILQYGRESPGRRCSRFGFDACQPVWLSSLSLLSVTGRIEKLMALVVLQYTVN